jgi:3-oxoacyl-[acyl-carrier protein] reductase
MVIIFGSAGVLGQALVDEAINSFSGPIILTANSNFDEVSKLQKKYSDRLKIIKCDVTNAQDVKNVFTYLKTNNIRVEAIINNFAFTFSDEGNFNFSADTIEVRKVFDVNYFGLAYILESSVLWAKDNGVSHLRVVNILSNALKTLNASNGHYIASKSAAELISKSYAKRYGQFLSINFVAPGLMKSKLTEQRFHKSHQKIIDVTPLGRLATPNEIAEVVLYLASSCPVAVSGQTIFVDGGRTL